MAIIDCVQIDNDLKDEPGKSVIEKVDGKINFIINDPDQAYDNFLHASITEEEYQAEINRIQAQLDLLESFAENNSISII